MRLINIKKMKLQEYFGSTLPKYAILSHTWGDDEVTFDQFQKGNAQDTQRFQKINYLCRQAEGDGYEYVWIDTCCIDKSSSSELTEAINSMFKWYQWAGVCYAYLVDVSDVTPLKNSRWFTRGWTLQELLAPREMKFFGTDWTYLGTKKSLQHALEDITWIDKQALKDPDALRVFSIATRMSWASSRTTTRLEDTAYSLLGIFGISMPLLYGEGDRAFRRLQEELIKASDDESIFAHWNNNEILAPEPKWFQGASKVEPLMSQRPRAPYAVTNKGLDIELPLLKTVTPKLYWGILNCNYRHDYSNYCAVILVEVGPRVFRKKAPSDSANPYLIDHTKMEKAERQQVYIQLDPVSLPLSYLIQCNPISELGFMLYEPVTRALKRSSTGVKFWSPAQNVMRILTSPGVRFFRLGLFFCNRSTLSSFMVIVSQHVESKKAHLQIAEVDLAAEEGEDVVARFLNTTLADLEKKDSKARVWSKPKDNQGEWVTVLIRRPPQHSGGAPMYFAISTAIKNFERLGELVWEVQFNARSIDQAEAKRIGPSNMKIPFSPTESQAST